MIGAKSNLTDNDLSCFGMNMLLQFCFVKQRDGESSHLLSLLCGSLCFDVECEMYNERKDHCVLLVPA